MQQIINAILKNRNFFIYLLLVLFSIIFLQNKSPYHQSKLREISLSMSGTLLNFRNNYQQYFQLKEINEELVRENLKLKSQLTKSESIRSIDIPTLESGNSKINLIPARIVKNSIGSVRNFIIVDKGEKDNVKTEMGVISADGIVGITNQTNQYFASAVSLLHRDLNINAKLKNNNAFGSLYWPGYESNKMILSDIPTINSINIGDTIVTGGMSAYFPKNIPIGEVSSFSILPSKRYYEIEVILFTNFSTLDHVFIVENLEKPYLDQISN